MAIEAFALYTWKMGSALGTTGGRARWRRAAVAGLSVLLVPVSAGAAPVAGSTDSVQAPVLASPDVVAAPGVGRPVQRAAFRRPAVGVQFHGLWSTYSDTERAGILDKVAAMGATWVRIDISWAMLQPTRAPIDPDAWGPQQVDKVITMAHRRGLKVLGTLWLTPPWAHPLAGERSGPADPRSYARALAWAARRWQGKAQAWEVWNEPNATEFFAGANPNRYARLLCASYRAVQAAPGPPAARIVYGGTMHNDVDWIRRTYQAGVQGCFDIMATHPYQSPADTSATSGAGASMWEFKHLRHVRSLMLRHGDRRPVWVTEFGWSSHRNRGGEANWERGVTRRQQAVYTVNALRLLRREFPFVRNAFLYTDRANPAEGIHQAGYGLLTHRLRPKPVYHALRGYLR
jgi:hypothetical protein